MESALVLGGGGVTGVAWELGILTGLRDAGVDLTTADLIVGTSAGSIVGALVATGEDVREQYEAQLAPAGSELAARIGLNVILKFLWTAVRSRTPEQFGVRIGPWARRSSSVPAAGRRAVIAARLPVQQWPSRRLIVTAVDAETGEFARFDNDSGADLVDAVAASCAVPGVWPPMPVNGRLYFDGGMRSSANADLAAGCRRVVVIAPVPRGVGTLTPAIKQVAALRAAGAQVVLISPDEQARRAIGSNVLDLSARAGAARAGLAQAASIAKSVAAMW